MSLHIRDSSSWASCKQGTRDVTPWNAVSWGKGRSSRCWEHARHKLMCVYNPASRETESPAMEGAVRSACKVPQQLYPQITKAYQKQKKAQIFATTQKSSFPLIFPRNSTLVGFLQPLAVFFLFLFPSSLFGWANSCRFTFLAVAPLPRRIALIWSQLITETPLTFLLLHSQVSIYISFSRLHSLISTRASLIFHV